MHCCGAYGRIYTLLFAAVTPLLISPLFYLVPSSTSIRKMWKKGIHLHQGIKFMFLYFTFTDYLNHLKQCDNIRATFLCISIHKIYSETGFQQHQLSTLEYIQYSGLCLLNSFFYLMKCILPVLIHTHKEKNDYCGHIIGIIQAIKHH